MCFLLTFHRYANVVRTFHFLYATLPTSSRGEWESKSRVSPKRQWTRSPGTHGPAIFGSCRILWREPRCYLPVHHSECRWRKSLLTGNSAASAGATCWSKPSESRSCERSAKAIGLSEVLGEPRLAWVSRGQHSPTRCRSWGSLARSSDRPLARPPQLCLVTIRPACCCRTYPADLNVQATTTSIDFAAHLSFGETCARCSFVAPTHL